jgi:hypothetical protein
MQSLVKLLLRIPGLTSDQVAVGLKVPPFKVMSVELEEQAQAMKNTLEKLGAVCEIEDTEIIVQKREVEKLVILKKEVEKKFELHFWLAILAVLSLFVFLVFYFSNDKHKPHSKPKKTQTAQTSQSTGRTGKGGNTLSPSAEAYAEPQKDSSDLAAKSKEDLKGELVKNPYNADAWRALSENLEKEGDTASARAAKESYDKAVKAQMVLSSLAKRFGNNVRVEITEDAIFYRTSKDFKEAEFYHEASKLRDSLSTKFPGKKKLVIENYTSDNQVQRIELEP